MDFGKDPNFFKTDHTDDITNPKPSDVIIKHQHVTKEGKVYEHTHKVELDESGRLVEHFHEAGKKPLMGDLSDMIYKELGGTDGGLDWMRTRSTDKESERDLRRTYW